MGSTIKRGKGRGHAGSAQTLGPKLLPCGCVVERPPDVSSPVKKWFCCGEYRKAKK